MIINNNLSFYLNLFKAANKKKSPENNSIMANRLMLKKYVGQIDEKYVVFIENMIFNLIQYIQN